jgi:hypothetical protein
MEMKFSFTPEMLNDDHSGTFLKELRKAGYHPFPIRKWGDWEYIFLGTSVPVPGRNRAEVINLTEFNALVTDRDIQEGRSQGYFQVATSSGGAWAFLAIDDGISLLTATPDDKFYDYSKPRTAVLTYRIEPPTGDDIRQTQDEMDSEW